MSLIQDDLNPYSANKFGYNKKCYTQGAKNAFKFSNVSSSGIGKVPTENNRNTFQLKEGKSGFLGNFRKK